MVKVLGHRGCAGIGPENTIRGFKRAMDLGGFYRTGCEDEQG